jgi:hypothetical protein
MATQIQQADVGRHLLARVLAETLLEFAASSETVALQNRVKHVVLEPQPQRNVPPAPELAERPGKERAVEVFGSSTPSASVTP